VRCFSGHSIELYQSFSALSVTALHYGFNTGAMTATIMLQEYAVLTTLVAQQQDRDTL